MTETGISVDSPRDGVAVVWLDRPDAGNAFTPSMQEALHVALFDLDRDPDVRVIVVTGRGRLFSAGADVSSGGSAFDLTPAETDELRTTIATRPRPWNLGMPIIGALNGSAVGLGLTLPLQWDIRVMAEDGKYGFVFPRRGITPEAASAWLLPRLVGMSVATELLLTGRFFSGREAASIGLATRAVPADEVLSTALEIANDIATNCSPLAVALTKRMLRDFAAESDRERAWSTDWELFRWIGRQPDAVEGVTSFLEKRSPQWPCAKDTEPPPAPVQPWEVNA